jgi:hypothetical protein
MSLSAKLRLGTVLVLWAPLSAAQSNLGALLDGGAKQMSAEEFREEVVQRLIVGLTAAGGTLEVIYANSGVIAGNGNYFDLGAFRLAAISGEWRIDDNGRVCTSMRISGAAGGAIGGAGAAGTGAMILPPRCQFWFKYNEAYFLCDSDSDRSAKVLRRTLKQ